MGRVYILYLAFIFFLYPSLYRGRHYLASFQYNFHARQKRSDNIASLAYPILNCRASTRTGSHKVTALCLSFSLNAMYGGEVIL